MSPLATYISWQPCPLTFLADVRGSLASHLEYRKLLASGFGPISSAVYLRQLSVRGFVIYA